MKANLPIDEALRLKALYDLAILDSPREQSFDDIAQVAMQLCNVPVAVVSLVDKDRQWFKSCLGLDATETPRDVAFCAHAILVPNDVLIVEDATKDSRFCDNALVTGAPYIRFYAGAPLITDDGMALGTLCVIDYQPRILSAAQIASLKALARQVVQLLRLRSEHDQREMATNKLSQLFEMAPIGILQVDENAALVEYGIAITRQTGIKICHETHRSRMLFASSVAKKYLQQIEGLRITFDVSHWCNVSESLLEDQPETLALTLPRVDHIHARIGHPQGPQVNDPRAPEWEPAVKAHFEWWDAIVALKQKQGEVLTILTEFGPPDYMPVLPYTKQPVANQWEINVHMLHLLRKRYQL